MLPVLNYVLVCAKPLQGKSPNLPADTEGLLFWKLYSVSECQPLAYKIVVDKIVSPSGEEVGRSLDITCISGAIGESALREAMDRDVKESGGEDGRLGGRERRWAFTILGMIQAATKLWS